MPINSDLNAVKLNLKLAQTWTWVNTTLTWQNLINIRINLILIVLENWFDINKRILQMFATVTNEHIDDPQWIDLKIKQKRS